MRRVLVLALAALLSPALARAAWLPGGNLIGRGDNFVATASNGRVVVAWSRQPTPESFEIRAQTWTPDGDIAPGWPSDGVLVGLMSGIYVWPAICEDGAGGAFVSWTAEKGAQRSFHLQHVTANGSIAPGWAAEGLSLGTAGPYTGRLALAHDGAGGALVGWIESYFDGTNHSTVRVHRVDAAGAPAAGWPVGGLAIPDAYDVGLAANGNQRVFVSTGEYRGGMGRLRIQRLTDDATPDPEWPQTGVVLPQAVAPINMRLDPDGTGGVFAGWLTALICLSCDDPGRATARIQRDGTPDAGWYPARYGYTTAPDGAGGMLLGIVSGGRPSVLRLDAVGAPMPGWAPGGNAVMTEVVPPYSMSIAGDGEGGAFVAWRDWRTGDPRLYASRLDAQGRIANGWPVTGSFVDADRGGAVYAAELVSLGPGVAIALWSEGGQEGLFGYLAALRPGEPGPLAELGPVPVEVGFGVVAVRPNPARGPIVAVVELSDEGPARIDLVDVTGRVRESQGFHFTSFAQQAGPSEPILWGARGAVRFNQNRALAAGVYWLRVTQGAKRSMKKIVVLE